MIEAVPSWVGPLLGGLGAGATGTAATIGKWVLETRNQAEQTHALLVGSEEIEGDGALEIMESNRKRLERHRKALEEADAVRSPHHYE